MRMERSEGQWYDNLAAFVATVPQLEVVATHVVALPGGSRLSLNLLLRWAASARKPAFVDHLISRYQGRLLNVNAGSAGVGDTALHHSTRNSDLDAMAALYAS